MIAVLDRVSPPTMGSPGTAPVDMWSRSDGRGDWTEWGMPVLSDA